MSLSCLVRPDSFVLLPYFVRDLTAGCPCSRTSLTRQAKDSQCEFACCVGCLHLDRMVGWTSNMYHAM